MIYVIYTIYTIDMIFLVHHEYNTMSPPLRVIKQATTTVPSDVLAWIAANPGQSAFLVTNGILIFTPAALTAPLLATMGFGAAGPVAGEF